MSESATRVRLAISLAITLIAVWLVAKYVRGHDFQAVFESTQKVWLLAAVVVFFSSLAIRALRLAVIYPTLQDFAWFFRTASYAAAMNFFLPARLGEFSLIALLARGLKQDFKVVTFSVLAIRLQELVCSLIIAFVLVLINRDAFSKLINEFQVQADWLSILVLSSVLVALAMGFRFRHHPLVQQMRTHLASPVIWVISALVTLAMFVFIFCIVRWLNIPEAGSLTPQIFIAVLLVSFLPANGLANTGGYHLAWVLPLVAMGYETENALTLAVLAHLCVTLIVGFALVCTAIMKGWRISPAPDPSKQRELDSP